MNRLSVTVKVPGKLFIAGEYAVTRPSSLAMVAAIETEFMLTIASADKISRLHTNVGIEDFEFSCRDFVYESSNPWNFVLAVLKKLSSQLEGEISINIQSGMGFKEEKKGYGSSASVVVAMVKGLNQFFDLNLSLAEEFKLAASVHYDVQGSGSMGDVAAIVYGGTVFYRNHDLIESVELPWEAFVIQTGKSVKTDEKLSIDFKSEFYQRSDELVSRLKSSHDFKVFKQILLENQELLKENLPADYVTEKLDFALKVVNSHPRLAGKISGAGFGENLIVFSEGLSQGELDLLEQSLEQKGMQLERIKIAKSNS